MFVDAFAVTELESSPSRRLVEGDGPEGVDGHGVVVVAPTGRDDGGHQKVDELRVRLQHGALVNDLAQLGSLVEPLDDHPGEGGMEGTRVPRLSLPEVDKVRQAQARSERKLLRQRRAGHDRPIPLSVGGGFHRGQPNTPTEPNDPAIPPQWGLLDIARELLEQTTSGGLGQGSGGTRRQNGSRMRSLPV